MAIGPIDFTATSQGVYVALQVFATGATEVTISRYDVFGKLLIVRSGEDIDITGDLIQLFDWEAPQGRTLVYRASVTDGVDTQVSEVICVGVVDYGGDWIMPVGRPEMGMNIVVELGGVGGLVRDAVRDVVSVINRPSPVVVSWGRTMWTSTISILTLEDADRKQLLALIQFPIIMFAARNGYGLDEPVFLSIGSITEERTSGLGYESSRRWSVDVTQVARPPAFYPLPVPTVTWQDRVDDGDTWGEVLASQITWFDYGGF